MTEIGTLNRQTPASTSSSACCLIENGKRCLRPAGSHCFSKRMQKTVRQKRLKVTIASEADHNLICQIHRQQLISQGKSEAAARKRPTTTNEAAKDSDDEGSATNRRRKTASIRFDQLSAHALRRYKKFFKLQTRPGLNKNQLADAVADHFRTIPVIDEKEILTYFVYAVKTKKNKLDQMKQNGNNVDD